MGFRPDWRGDPNYVDYVKDFAEAHGRMGRLAVRFTKDSYSQVLDSARLANFVVTVQGQVDPVIDEVREKAPKAMQADMLNALKLLEGVQEPDVDQTAVCDRCGLRLVEWTADDEGRVSCLRPDICDERKYVPTVGGDA